MNDAENLFPKIPERLPARVSGPQAAALLGFQEHDIPPLIEARLLKPLGNPRPYAVRFFSTPEILEMAGNRQWLAKATNAIYEVSLRRKTAPQGIRGRLSSHSLP